MIYENGNVWKAAKHKKVLLFAMSGLGKTHVSSMLRNDGDWFHYSVDYRLLMSIANVKTNTMRPNRLPC